MNKLLLGLAAVPLLAGGAMAAQPLTDSEMDGVTAGFTSLATAEAQGLGKIVTTESATVALVAVVTTSTGAPVQATFGETTLTLIKSVAAAQSSSFASNTLPTASIGLTQP